MADYLAPLVASLAEQPEQDEFAALLPPIIAALPEEADAELIGNIVAAIITEFTSDEATARWICLFAAEVVAVEMKRQMERRN